MQQPTQLEHDNIYEIRFKNTRKGFYRNANGLSLITGDFVAVESDRGFDVGQVSLGGVLAQLQMKKKRVNPEADDIRKIYRRSTKDDLEKLKKARSREQETLVRTRIIVSELRLDMKASDVEYQGDNTKAIFYYIADNRVDFRELIKRLANEFRIRVEMKQIGLRHESGLVGGIGSCGRELCCSTWLTDFKTVSTAAARYQNLSLNPMKISGQCGRLKCCLNFELETYMDALRDIPKADKIETEIGPAYLQKTDIFKRIMWFCYRDETTWIPLAVEKVNEMVAMNEDGKKPPSLHLVVASEAEVEVDFVDVVGQSTLREDPKRRNKKKKRKPRNQAQNQNKDQSGANSNSGRRGNSRQGTPGDNPERQRGRNPRRNNRNTSAEGDNQNASSREGDGDSGNKPPSNRNAGGRGRGGKRTGRKPNNDSRNDSRDDPKT
jgi:cell fate regulator YaaT (PSP1 superfamily)